MLLRERRPLIDSDFHARRPSRRAAALKHGHQEITAVAAKIHPAKGGPPNQQQQVPSRGRNQVKNHAKEISL